MGPANAQAWLHFGYRTDIFQSNTFVSENSALIEVDEMMGWECTVPLPPEEDQWRESIKDDIGMHIADHELLVGSSKHQPIVYARNGLHIVNLPN